MFNGVTRSTKTSCNNICSPSYWDVKIGKPLKVIHDPVTSLDEKIGERIATFSRQAPIKTHC